MAISYFLPVFFICSIFGRVAAQTCTPACATNAYCTGTNVCTCISGWSGTNCNTAANPEITNYAFDYSFVNNGSYTHLDAYIIGGPVVGSNGAIRLVGAVSDTKGSIWSKTAMALWDFKAAATIEIGITGQGGDGFGIFVGWNLLRATTNGADTEFGVKWSNYSGLAVMFSPRYGAICALSSATAIPLDRTCNSSAISASVAMASLRKKMRVEIVVRNAESITVDVCTTSGCQNYLNGTFSAAFSSVPASMYFGVGAQSTAGTTDYVDLYDLKVYSLATCSPSCVNGGYCLSSGSCKCATGWSGTDCSIPVCTTACVTNAYCSAPNTCTCIGGWTGADCTTPICAPACVTHAYCSAPNTCTCISSWSGTDCTIPVCTTPCVTNAYCSAPNTCTCIGGWTGADCTTPVCAPACVTHAYCSAPNTCTCTTSWSGTDCTIPVCTSPCVTNAYCTAPSTCTCISGWSGTDCTTAAYPATSSYAFDYSFNNNGSYTHLDTYIIGGSVVGSNGAIRLVGAVNDTKGSIWGKTAMALWDFAVNATIEIGRTGQGGDGFGIFVGWNLLRATTNGANTEFGVKWNNYSGLAVMFSPRYGAICALSSATAIALDRTCTGSSPFNATVAKALLRQKMRVGIVVRNAKSITVDVCTTSGCQTYLDNKTFPAAFSSVPASMYFGVGAQSTAGTTDYVELYDLKVYSLATCSPTCVNGGYCLSSGSCKCVAGWSGTDCSIPSCNPACAAAGWCTGVNVCSCAPGWIGATCNTVASCATPCPANAHCTGTNTCSCLTGWSGDNCTTPTQWTFPVESTISQYTLEKGDTSNYNLYIWNTITNPQPSGAIRLLSPTAGIVSYLFTKIPISGLSNFNVNATILVGNTGTKGDGFAIEILSNSTIQRQAGNNYGWGTAQRAGLTVSVSPYSSVIGVTYSAAATTYSVFSASSAVAKYSIPGDPHLRQKMHIGLSFDNNILTSVYMCNVTSCKYILQNLHLDISQVPSPLFLGMTGFCGSSYDFVDIFDIKVYSRDTCTPKCIYGHCDSVSHTCKCSPGFTGSTCASALCTFPCLNGGTCTSPEVCTCTVDYAGFDCGLVKSNFMKVAVDYQLTGATTLSTFQALSGADCAVTCKNTSGCLGANYRTSDRTCYLLNKGYSGASVTLECAAGYTHYTMDGMSMPNYILSRQMACDFMNGPCPKIYQQCQAACTANRWVGSCQSTAYHNCSEALANGNTRTGVYLLNPDGGTPFEAYCEMQSDALAGGGGGYITILRRKDGSVGFNLALATMRNFFGDLNGEFWIGADNLNRLTSAAPPGAHELLYLFWPFEPDGNKAFARWSQFSIGNYASGYLLSESGFLSPITTSDIFGLMNGNTLKTVEMNNFCVSTFLGPSWTYPTGSNCHFTNPFGRYLYGYQTAFATGITTNTYMGQYYSMRSIEWRLK